MNRLNRLTFPSKSSSPHLLWLAASLACLVAACASGPEPSEGSDEQIESQTEALYVLSTHVWPSPVIPVCWENPTSENAKKRGWVRDQIARTWERHSAVVFDGWDRCSANSRGIRIRVKDTHPKTLGLGRALDGKPDGMLLDFRTNPSCPVPTERCLRATATHEFGHALGFAHEHNRPDTPSWCREEPQGSYGDTLLGKWDENSIMNYCQEGLIPNHDSNLVRREMSDRDKDGVAKTYGRHGMYTVAAKPSGQLDPGDMRALVTSGYYGYPNRRLADVNGDGFLDYVAMSGDHAYVVPGNDAGLFDHDARQYMNAVYFDWPWQQLADVNNDGFLDFVATNGDHAYVVPGTASGNFDHNARQYMNAVYFDWGFKQLADVNNDGFVDFVSMRDKQAYVVPGTSSGKFDHAARQYMTADYFDYAWKRLADVNGDGFVDFVAVGNEHAYVVPGTASGKFEHAARQYSRSDVFRLDKFLNDVNGDGRSELITFK